MGDPKKRRKKYSGPRHPWEADRIVEEKKLTEEFGLRNKKEIWRIQTLLKGFRDRVKKMITLTGRQAELEKKHLHDKVVSLGLLPASEPLDAILALDVKSLMNRRLQTVVMTKGLARTASQSRQMIVHEHIAVDGTKVTFPSYLVRVAQEANVSYSKDSPFNDKMHPEMVIEKKAPEEGKPAEEKAGEQKSGEEKTEEAPAETATKETKVKPGSKTEAEPEDKKEAEEKSEAEPEDKKEQKNE